MDLAAAPNGQTKQSKGQRGQKLLRMLSSNLWLVLRWPSRFDIWIFGVSEWEKTQKQIILEYKRKLEN